MAPSNGKTTLPPGTYATDVVSVQDKCPHCLGRMRIAIRTRDGIIGYLVSDYAWNMEIDDDKPHPTHPHYLMEWRAEDNEGRQVGPDNLLPHQLGNLLMRRHQRRGGNA